MDNYDYDLKLGNYFEIIKSDYSGLMNLGGAQPIRHNYAHLYFIVSGKCSVTIGKKNYVAEENSILYIPKNTSYIQQVKNSACEYYSFLFEYNDDEAHYKLPIPVVFKPKIPGHYLDLFKISHSLSVLQPYGYKLKIRRNIISAVDKIADEYLMNSNNVYVIRKSVDYLNANYTLPNISISTVSDYSGITPVHFRRVFKNIYGMTPVKYINQLRINEAKSLLTNTNLSIEHIAYKCGYSDYSYFARVFSKAVGMTPSQYRDENKI